MKFAVQTVGWGALALAACRAEPSRAPAAGEATLAATAPAPPHSSAAAPAETVAPPSASRGQTPNEERRPGVVLRTFETDAVNAAPGAFSFGLTGKGAPGKWLVKAEAGAPSGANVLAQTDPDDTNFRFPVAVLNEPVLKDIRVSVRCKLISGKVDQACGLVARYRDENNYFITRANALEDNIRLYTIQNGRRTEIASRDIEVSPNVWHDYRFELRGDHLQVFWNGERVLDHQDGTFTEAGRGGVWTKADSITHFDNLTIEANE